MWMEEGLDTGPMLKVREEPIRDDDTAGTLGDRLARMGATLAVETVASLAAGDLTATAQPDDGVTIAPLLTKDDGRLDWSRPAAELDRLVRGTAPWPGAWCPFRGKTLKVHEARPTDQAIEAPIGAIAAVDDGGLVVRCGEGALRLTRVQPPGKRAMAVADFLRGTPIEPGESLAEEMT
jgi:methionyl-tRNA formyltransferase